MEKVKIKTVVDTGKVWKDKKIFAIELEDGRKGNTFEDASKWAGEMELDIRDGKEYQGQKQLVFYLPKTEGQKAGFTKKDWSYEKRRASLEFALKIHDSVAVSVTDVISTAEKLFEYLNK